MRRFQFALAALALLASASDSIASAIAPPPRAPRAAFDVLGRALPPASATSGADPRALASAPGGASPRTSSVSDGAGGFYLIYPGGFINNYGSAPATAGQAMVFQKTWLVHVGANGLPASGWPADGIPVTAAADNHGGAVFTSDGAGGVIVAWDDFTSFDVTIRAQRIDPTGARLWGDAGVLVGTGAGAGYRYVDDVQPDGAGGALVSWKDSGVDPELGQDDIWLQRVTSAGAVSSGWPANGVLVCGAAEQQYDSRIVPDGSGGAIVGWHDWRAVSSFDLYAQHVTGAGVADWTANGIQISVGVPNPRLAFTTDGAGGMIVGLPKFDGANWNMYAQRYDPDGNIVWTPGGVALSAANMHQSDISLAPDGAGGAIACWYDFRNNVSIPEIYAQHVTSTGALSPGWAANGVYVGGTASETSGPRIAPDGGGGAFIEWEVLQYITYSAAIVAQRILGNGLIATGWSAGGTTVTGSGSLATPYGMEIVPDGASGLICSWNDIRDTGAGNGLYAQRLGPTSTKLWDPDGAVAVAFKQPSGAQSQPAMLRRAAGGVQVAWQQWETGSGTVQLRGFDTSGIGAGPAAPLSGTPAVFQPPAVPDGLGGAFLAWIEFGPGGYEAHAQRVDGDGTELWGQHGVVVPDISDPSGTYLLGMVADGTGGVILARADISGGLRLQRLDANGAAQWPGGVLINSDGPETGNASFVSDDENGVIAVWEIRLQDAGTLRTYTNVVAQRVDSSGIALWGPTGVYLAPGVRDEAYPRATRDGFGGAIVTWMGDQIFVGTDVWTQRITSTGSVAPGWPATGVLTGGATGRQILPDVAPDLLGGAFVAWSDGRGSDVKVFAQHLDLNGVPKWAAYGLPVASSTEPQFLQMVQADNTAGFHLAWLAGSKSWDVYGQRMNSASTLLWTANGLGICTEGSDQFGAILLAGNAGGTFAAWVDYRDKLPAVFIQRINPSGVIGFATDGTTGALASLEHASAEPGLVRLTWWTDGSLPGAVIERAGVDGTWRALAPVLADGTGRLRYEDRDVAPGARYGYRLRIERSGASETLGETWIDVPLVAEFALDPVRPNPSAGDVTCSFALPARGRATIEVIDVAGRRVLSREIDAAAGRNLVPLGTLEAPPGVYALRITFAGRALTSRFVRTR